MSTSKTNLTYPLYLKVSCLAKTSLLDPDVQSKLSDKIYKYKFLFLPHIVEQQTFSQDLKSGLKWTNIHVHVLSNRPQVSMVYKLINHAGCWWNTSRICKPQAAGKWFTNSSSVLPTSQVVYQPITHRKLVVYCFYIIIQKTRDFSVGLLAQ